MRFRMVKKALEMTMLGSECFDGTRCSCGSALGSHLYIDDAPRITAKAIGDAVATIAELSAEHPEQRISAPLRQEDAVLLSLQLRDWAGHLVWEQGHQLTPCDLHCGETVFYDLRRDPRVLINRPFQKLAVYIPRAVFDALEDEAKSPPIGDISYRPGVGIADRRVRNVGSVLVSELAQPGRADLLFIGYEMLALTVHVASVYGNFRPNTRLKKGGLAPWQAKRAKEMLSEKLDSSLNLKDLASECGLSVSHFSRAFHRSTGMAPHQWRIKRRVEMAKTIMRRSREALPEIALECGFTDQSHFSRIFTRYTGTSPGQWRRCFAE